MCVRPTCIFTVVTFQLHLLDIIGGCNDFIVSAHQIRSTFLNGIHLQKDNREAKLNDITDAVLRKLTFLCAECGISGNIIDMQSFRCSSESPSHVTYRARLQGTSETNSSALISLIEEWVKGEADIVVTGLLVTVDSMCLVEIPSFSEKDCSVTTTPNPTMDTTDSSSSSIITSSGIIGVVTAVVVTMAITIIVAVVILKFRLGNHYFKNTK